MESVRRSSLIRDLDALYQVGALGRLSDLDLIQVFIGRKGDAADRAFEAIVHRHGPMVLGVCRRMLGDDHRAEDAFQATFLVLALKANTIRKPGSLGPWLHGVAARISRRARVLVNRRREQPLDVVAGKALGAWTADCQVESGDLRAVLDEEIARLPAAYRRAVILCYLEGKTQEDAARELGWSKEMVSGRLARAKDRLRARLIRRGFSPSAGPIGTILTAQTTSPAVPSSLATDSVRTACWVLLGSSPNVQAPGSVAALARATLRSMLLSKVKSACAALLMTVGFATVLAQTAPRPSAARPHDTTEIQGPMRLRSTGAAKAPGRSDRHLPRYARGLLGTTRLRHDNAVFGIAFAPDGRTLASCSWDETVRFWDLATGEPSSGFPVIPEEITLPNVVSYSPDGTKLAIGCAGVVRIWDLTARKECTRTPVHPGRVWEIAFAPDGRTLASTSDGDSRVRIWDVATGVQRRALSSGVVAIQLRPLAFSPDGKRLAMAGNPNTTGDRSRVLEGDIISIWQLDGGSEPLIIRKAHEGWSYSLAFTPQGTLISSGCRFLRPKPEVENQPWEGISQIRVWDANSGQKLKELELGSTPGMCRIALSRDGKTLVSTHRDRILAWELPSGKRIQEIGLAVKDDSPHYRGIAVAPDGRTAAAVRGDYVVHLWDVASGKPLLVEEHAQETCVYSVAVSPDGRSIATGDGKSTLRLWDPDRGKVLHRLCVGDRDQVTSVRFSPDGRTLAAASDLSLRPSAGDIPGVVRLWDWPGLQRRHELRVDHPSVLVEFSPDGRHVAVASWDFQRHMNGLVNGRKPADDDLITLFDSASDKKEFSLPGHAKRMRAIAFARDGRTLATAAQDNTFRFWDLTTRRLIREIPIHGHRFAVAPNGLGLPNEIAAAAFSPDLTTAVTGRPFDDRLLVWDLRTGRIRRTIQAEAYWSGELAISPNGRLVAWAPVSVGGKTHAPIHFWDINTKREVLQLGPLASSVQSLAFSADGKTLVSGMQDTTALVWDISAAYASSGRQAP
jgi:RNA polymerase sigma factor (sigma-70 family)